MRQGICPLASVVPLKLKEQDAYLKVVPSVPFTEGKPQSPLAVLPPWLHKRRA